ncbi:MAG: PPC domain-containing protein [Polyangiales bacterium]
MKSPTRAALLALVATLACSRSRRTPARAPAARAATAAPSPRTPAWTQAYRLRTRAFDFEPWPDAVVHAPAGFDASRPLHLVVVFHGLGHSALVWIGGGLPSPVDGRPIVGWGGEVRHDMAATNTLLVALQFEIRPGRPHLGRYAQRGTLARVLTELLGEALAPRIGRRALSDVAAMTLVGSSAGGPAIATFLARHELDDKVQNVVLYDALYGSEATFASWMRASTPERPRRLVCLHAGSRYTKPSADRLAALLRPSLGDALAVQPRGAMTEAVRAHRAVFAVVDCEHICMGLAFFDKVLAGLALPPRAPDPDPKEPIPGAAPQGGELRREARVQGVLDARDAVLRDGSAYEDWTLALARGERVTIELAGGQVRGFLCHALDVELRVLDGDAALTNDDDSGGSLRSRVTFTAPRDGRFTVRVMTHGPWANLGPWTLTVAPAD